MKYKSYLVLGDWSNDGHGKEDKILLETNHPVEVIQQAYKDSCKLTGVSFNHNDDFTGIKRDYKEADKFHIATEYEQYDLSQECFEALNKFGFSKDFKIDNVDDFELAEEFPKLWIWFVKLSLPDLEANIIKDNIPVINGYWNKNLNVQFGYGLFS